MEKNLLLRKPSNKPLVVLLNIAEQLLFAFPVSPDIISKYSAMRSKVFSKLKLKYTPLPTPSLAVPDSASSENPESPTANPIEYSTKVVQLELISLLQSSQNLNESYMQEFDFTLTAYANIFNSISEILGSKEKLEISAGSGSKKEKTAEISIGDMDFDVDEEIEKARGKYKRSFQRFKEIKHEVAAREKKILCLMQGFEVKWEKEKEIIKKKYSHEAEEGKKYENSLNERLEMITSEIKDISESKESDKRLYEEQIKLLVSQISEMKKETYEKIPKENTNSNDNSRIEEIIRLKEKILFLEEALSEKSKEIISLVESNKHLTYQYSIIERKLAFEQSQQEIIESECENAKFTLEEERISFESQKKSLQEYYISKEESLKQSNEEYLYSLQNSHHQSIESLKLSHNKELSYMREEIYSLKSQLTYSADSNTKLIKSLQIELLKEKDSRLKLESLQNENQHHSSIRYENQKILEKLEKELPECLNALHFVNEIVSPIYLNYVNLQKDWAEDMYLRNIEERVGPSHLKVLIHVEFLVFYLEKTLRDNEWLINKLTELQEGSKLNKTVSVGTLASPHSVRDSKMFKKIWGDIKDSAESLKKFEKSRENLIVHFNKY